MVVGHGGKGGGQNTGGAGFGCGTGFLFYFIFSFFTGRDGIGEDSRGHHLAMGGLGRVRGGLRDRRRMGGAAVGGKGRTTREVGQAMP